VLTWPLEDLGAAGREAVEQRPRRLVRAVLRPEHAHHAQLQRVRLSPQPLHDQVVLGAGQRHLAQLPVAYHGAHPATPTTPAAATTERKSRRPSSPPSPGSAQRSGCGIIPSTLPSRLTSPAMLCCEPVGLAAGRTLP